MSQRKILIIGTIHLKEKMLRHKEFLEMGGNEVRLPVMDDYAEASTAIQVIEINIELIRWADEVKLFWDGKSVGTVADWQTAVALGKKVVPVFIEENYTYTKAIKEHFLKNKVTL